MLPDPSARGMSCSWLGLRAALMLLGSAVASGAAGSWQETLQNAVALHGSGDHSRAAEGYRQALEAHEPLRKAWPVLNNFGLVIQAEAPLEAARAFRDVIELNPAGADGYFNLGNALSDAGQPSEAVAAFTSCLEISPADAEAYYSLGGAHLVSGGQDNAECAVVALRTSLSLQEDPKTLLSLGDALAATRRWDEAVEAYRRGNAARPTHAAGRASLGNAFEEGGRYDEAEVSWRAALSLAPADAGTYQNLGQMLRRRDRLAESKAAYEAAVAVDPTAAEAYVGLGKCYSAPRGGAAGAARRGATYDDEYLDYLSRTYGVALRLQVGWPYPWASSPAPA